MLRLWEHPGYEPMDDCALCAPKELFVIPAFAGMTTKSMPGSRAKRAVNQRQNPGFLRHLSIFVLSVVQILSSLCLRASVVKLPSL